MASPKRRRKTKQQKSLELFPYIQRITSLLLIIAGSGLLIFSASQKIVGFTNPSQSLSSKGQTVPQARPVKLYIPAMTRILYVSDGFTQNNRWAISQTGVSYLTSSALPGSGNTVIYGHNTRDILGGLWKVQEGDYIYLVLATGDIVKYQIFERKEIDPTQVEILNQTQDSRLTIYTCSGFLDDARFVIVGRTVSS